MMRRVFLALLVLVTGAQAADPVSKVIFPNEERITGLKFKSDILDGEIEGGTKYAILEGRFPKPNWTLIATVAGSTNKNLIDVSKTGEFVIRVPVRDREITYLTMHAVGPGLESQKQSMELRPWKGGALPSSSFGEGYALVPSLGYTLVNYKETFTPDFTETALTLKLSYSYVLKPPRWSLGVTTFVTVLPMNPSPSDRSLRFLGVNARVGYAIPLRGKWRLIMMVGGYFTTTFGGTNFGFQNMQGPQIFPVVRYDLSDENSFIAYLKYSPITQEFMSFTFSSYETAIGGAWTHRFSEGHSLSVSVDYARMDLNFSRVVFVKANSLTFGVGWGL